MNAMRAAQITILFIVIVVAGLPAGAQFYDGNQLVAFMRSYEKCDREPKGCDFIGAGVFMGFVRGVSDSHESDYCPTHVQVLQVYTSVVKYLNDHPEEWSKPAHELVVRALKQAFPCRKPTRFPDE
jgi:hypothetical protein